METTEQNFSINRVSSEEAEESVSGSRQGRTSQYEPILEAYKEALAEEEALTVGDMSENDVQNLRNLFYRRFDKEDVIVRSKKTGDDEFLVAIRKREDGEYLRNGEPDVEAETEGAISDEDVMEDTAEDDNLTEGSDEGEDDVLNPSF